MGAMRAAVVVTLLVAFGCGGDDDDDTSSASADLGNWCDRTAGTAACGAPLECGDMDAIGGFVCTKTCDSDVECPSNGICYVFDGDDGHVCARECATDADCDPAVPGLSCIELRSPAGRKICAN
jgi:hypothetical protein